jgi:hypothetical protein
VDRPKGLHVSKVGGPIMRLGWCETNPECSTIEMTAMGSAQGVTLR